MVNIAQVSDQADQRRSLMEVLEFLTRRGVSADVIQLSMVRAGISVEVARILAQCIVTIPAQPAAPLPSLPPRIQSAPMQNDQSSRAAEIALRKLIGLMINIAVIWGVGITLGFVVGIEMGLAQGLEAGLDRVTQLFAAYN